MADDLQVVQTFNSDIEAEMAQGLLENEGIPSMVLADDVGGMHPQFRQISRGVRLLVAPELAGRAREILGVDADLE